MIFSGLLAAVIAWLVPTYVPRLIESFGDEPLVHVSLRTDPAEIDAFADSPQAAVLPAGRNAGAPATGCRGFRRWVRERGGVDAGSTELRLLLEGSEAGGISIDQVRARILERRPPLKGARASCRSAGVAAARNLYIDLDSSNPIAHYVTLAGKRPLVLTLKQDEVETLDIRASTRRCYCRWVLEMTATVDGKQETLTVMDAGEPFETTPEPSKAAREQAVITDQPSESGPG